MVTWSPRRARTRTPRTVAAAAVVTLAAGALAVTPAAQADGLADQLAQAMAVDGATVTGAAFVAHPGFASAAVGTTPLAGFPKDGDSFAILSTGRAADVYPDPDGSAPGEDTPVAGPDRGDTARDVTTLRVDIDVPEGANCITGVDFRFLSSEFPQFVASQYNDAFIFEIDSSTWTTSATEIQAPNNRAFDELGHPITVKGAGATSMTTDLASGTSLTGSTRTLTAQTPISAGEHSLYFSVLDQSDEAYDSAVLIDNLTVGSVDDVASECRPGVTPVAAQELSAPAPSFDDTDDTVTIPAHDPAITYLVDGVPTATGTHAASGTITVRAAAGNDTYVNGASEWTHTFPQRVTTSVTPPAPTFADLHDGTGLVTIPLWVGVTYRLDDEVVTAGVHPASGQTRVVATPAPGFHLSGPASWTHDFPTGVAPGNLVQALAPVADQLTHSIVVPDLPGVVYSLNGRHVDAGVHPVFGQVTVTAELDGVDETALLSGPTSWTFEFPAAPAEPVVPVAPTFVDGADGGTVELPATDGWSWLVNGVARAAGSHAVKGPVRVVAVPAVGRVISGTSSWTHTFLLGTSTTQVTPEAPTFTDLDGNGDDTVTIPSQTGVAYLRDGVVVPAGTYPVAPREDVTIDAVPTIGYALLGVPTWSYTFTSTTITNSVAPTITGTAAPGGTLTGHSGVWTYGSWTRHYRWLREGTEVATGSTYAPTPDDVGKALTFEVSLTGLDALPGKATSAPVTVVPGAAPTATVRPALTGTPRYGATLSSSPGTWTAGSWTTSYQWLRNGAAITGATASTYRVTGADAGKTLSARVTAGSPGYTSGTATTVTKAVPKLASTATVKLSATRVRPSTRAKVTVTVSAPGTTTPAGTVRIKRVLGRKTVVLNVALRTTGRGKVTATLPKLSRGTWKISAQFLGSSTVAASRYSAAKSLSVR